MSKNRVIKENRSIDKTFYFRLVIYIVILLISIYLLAYSVATFSMVAGIDIVNLPSDICDETSANFDQFLCFINTYKDGSFYYAFYYLSLFSIIAIIMIIIIINVLYIINRFYFKILHKEKSCGAVLYREKDNKIEYLTLYMSHGHVSLCKGHQIEGETDEQTAYREIKEETGYDVVINSDFFESINYSLGENRTKDVYFFVAEVTEDKKPVDEHDEEVVGFEWVNLEKGLDLLTYDTDRTILIKADRFIKKLLNKKKTPH
ncbi:MAG: NUDIX domain-containing protein [Bacilli bacterium]|nr:NUDIX domain-containing protein [Bacilli bacterium]